LTGGKRITEVDNAMVLAAGFGQRMRPLTNTTPKPLIKVARRPLIDFAFEHLRKAKVRHAVVNVHYLADQLIAWSKSVPEPAITISDETDTILDTGGGIARALPLLGKEPFFVMNSDSFWIDHGAPALERLKTRWDPDRMDCLLLLMKPEKTTGYDGAGDFEMAEDGRLRRKDTGPEKALTYIGGYLVHPRLFDAAPKGAFSMNLLWDKAIAAGRLYGLEQDGQWLHVGTPDAIAKAEEVLANYRA
jgi:N-acetyl-alpha-D-muramate 1-phosphate uridylyltransferase